VHLDDARHPTPDRGIERVPEQLTEVLDRAVDVVDDDTDVEDLRSGHGDLLG
jgi:hypothetical protein